MENRYLGLLTNETNFPIVNLTFYSGIRMYNYVESNSYFLGWNHNNFFLIKLKLSNWSTGQILVQSCHVFKVSNFFFNALGFGRSRRKNPKLGHRRHRGSPPRLRRSNEKDASRSGKRNRNRKPLDSEFPLFGLKYFRLDFLNALNILELPTIEN